MTQQSQEKPATATRRPGRARASVPPDMTGHTVRRWALKLVDYGCQSPDGFVRPDGFSNLKLAEALGIPGTRSKRPFNRTVAQRAVHAQITRLEAICGRTPPLPPTLADNLTALSRVIGISETDQRLLGFLVAALEDSLLQKATETLGSISNRRFWDVIGHVLNLSALEVSRSLSPTGPLVRLGLVTIDSSYEFPWHLKFDLPMGFAPQIYNQNIRPNELLSEHLREAAPLSVNVDDLELGIPELKSLVVPYLRHALQHRISETVLLWGPPGHGKSSAVAMIAKELSAPLYDVAITGRNGAPLSGSQRLTSWSLMRMLLRGQPAIIRYDELDESAESISAETTPAKAWLNNELEREEGDAVTVFTTNALPPPHVLRRFGLIVHVSLNVAARKQLLLRMAREHLTDAGASDLARHEGLSPAIIAKACAVANGVQPTAGHPARRTTFLTTLRNALHAQSGIRPAEPNLQTTEYDFDLVNTDVSIRPLLDGLRTHGKGAILAAGLPGTGKSGFAEHVARELSRPLLKVTAADLLSKFVGETEEKIRHHFDAAEKAGAVLCLDEIDSLVRDRRHAQASHEVSATNQLLNELSHMRSIVIASTNVLEVADLDPAVQRRFMRVRFLPLRADQATVLLDRHAKALGLDTEDPATRPAIGTRLHRLVGSLTAGDFARVTADARLLAMTRMEDYLTRLEVECAQKPGAIMDKRIGFI